MRVTEVIHMYIFLLEIKIKMLNFTLHSKCEVLHCRISCGLNTKMLKFSRSSKNVL